MREAEAACSTPNDKWSFARGIILLHDATEIVLIAIVSHLNALQQIKKNTSLLDYCDFIQKVDPHNEIRHKQELKNLNTIRNHIKHEGLLVDVKSNAYLVNTISNSIVSMCKTYLNIEFSEVRLTLLIRNKKIQHFLKEAEDHYNEKKYEKALISLGYAMFYTIDNEAITWSFFHEIISGFSEKETPEIVYPDFNTEHMVRLIQYGIDPYLHKKFHQIVPLIGRKTKDFELIYEWKKEFGHQGNWTEKNVSFCLHLVIDTALKCQREDSHDYSIKRYSEIYEDIIEPVKDQAIIWNTSNNAKDYFLHSKLIERKPLFILSKNQYLIGQVKRSDKKSNEVFIMFYRPSEGELEDFNYGYVAESEIKVTSRKKMLDNFNPPSKSL
ncbi:MAG: hypothetical protein K1X66_04080 [Verrucomicrobiae bacterium]|nr:hypothetical protein [Verrucomicrobiae bacterium]